MDTSPSLRCDAVELILNRHATRRAGGLPTVSVLVGPVGAAIAAFRAWANGRGQPAKVGSCPNLSELATLFAWAAGTRDLTADAYSYLATHTGRSAPEIRAALAGTARHDLDQFFEANDARLPSGDGTRMARLVCEATLAGGAAGAERIAAGVAPWPCCRGLLP